MFFDSLTREARFLGTMARVGLRVRGLTPGSETTVADLIEHWARRTPDAIAIHFEGDQISYAELDARANQIAHWALEQGIERREVVALLMENRPEFLSTWLGLAKVGATTALINSNLTGGPLAHSIRISGARRLILGSERQEAWRGALELLEERPEAWSTGAPVEDARDLDAAIARASDLSDPDWRTGMTAREKLFYIYTSGTTGNPKAANISHFRFLSLAQAFAAITSATARDRMYVVLPLYHSAGGCCAIGTVFAVGGSIVLRRRFSAGDFWREVRDEEVTLFQYIGELCRYLVNSPEQAAEREHRMRLAIGNGLRPDVWQSFQERFRVPQIIEFYGATEGNVALVNLDGKVGAIGRIPPYLRRVMNVKLVRFDVEREEPVRGADGFCIECETGEAGEALGEIPRDSKLALGQFEGYSDEHATSTKVLTDVFRSGDRWFRTGDLLRRDDEGYYYFVDRIGDTFRWKGENVSTNEVAEVLDQQPGVREANVYGVRVGDADGRAGMASLVVDDGFDLASLYARLQQELPVYARPLFLRLTREIEVTATFKHRKVDLVRDGYDPSRVDDPIYFSDPESKRYVELDAGLYRRITAGEIRL